MASAFRKALEAAVLERHCMNHPLTNEWAKGKVSRNAMMGWGVQHYHWVTKMREPNFTVCSKAPTDVVLSELENFHEENDPKKPHRNMVLHFAEVNGANLKEVRSGRGLPTTSAWTDWLTRVTREQPWYCGLAAIRVGTESQSPKLYGKLLPALRKIYKFKETDIEHFWVHAEADIEHGERGYAILERHCKTREEKDMAVYYAGESARMRWFYFDGIYLHYQKGYALA